jgi:hypothetical protein
MASFRKPRVGQQDGGLGEETEYVAVDQGFRWLFSHAQKMVVASHSRSLGIADRAYSVYRKRHSSALYLCLILIFVTNLFHNPRFFCDPQADG